MIFGIYNQLIDAIYQAGLTRIVYQGFNIINISVLVLFSVLYAGKFRIKKKNAFLYVLIVYSLGYLWIYFQGFIASGFRFTGRNNIVKGFVFFPFFILLASKILHEDKNKLLDLSSLTLTLLQGVAHIACSIAGCCYGYEWKHGILNVESQKILFPIQLLESFVSICIFISLLILVKKKNYQSDGTLYPIFLIAFGSTRFFLEFLRDNDKLFLNISNLALWALLMVIVGIAWLSSIPAEKDKSNNKHRKKTNSKFV